MLSLWHLAVFSLAVLAILPETRAEFNCTEPCRVSDCNQYCRNGYTRDACDCCWVCKRTEGEVCGGKRNENGVCGKGTVCINMTVTREEQNGTKGTCMSTRDCVQSPWGPWSECSKACGLGVQKRKRIVLYYPRNGGKSCAKLTEERGCAMHKCNKDNGIAQILPAVYRRLPFGSYKYEDILPAPKTLDKEYHEKMNRKSYCVTFKLLNKHPYCRGTWAEKMSKQICVECQPAVMDKNGHCLGHGKKGLESQWVAVDQFSCHGLWVRVGPKTHNCSCNKKGYSNFIFI